MMKEKPSFLHERKDPYDKCKNGTAEEGRSDQE